MRYECERVSAPTKYCTKHNTDSYDEVLEFVREYENEISASVSVWDREKHDEIYWKRCFCYKPEVDLIER